MPQNSDNNNALSSPFSAKEQNLLLDALYGTLSESEITIWQNIQQEKPAIADEYERLQATVQQLSAVQLSFTDQSVFRLDFFEQQWLFLQRLMKSEREAVFAPVLPNVSNISNISTKFELKGTKLRFLERGSSSRWYALAAMILVAIGIGTSLWQWQNSLPQSQQKSTLHGMTEKADEEKSITQNRTNTNVLEENRKEKQNVYDANKNTRSREITKDNALLKTTPKNDHTPTYAEPTKPFSDDGININKKSATTQDVLPSADPAPEALQEETKPETKQQPAPTTVPATDPVIAPILRNEQMRNSFMPSGAASKSLPKMNTQRTLSTSATQKIDTASVQKKLADTLHR